MSKWQDYYTVLGILKSASQDEIKKAYRGLAKKHHPDKFPDPKEKEAAVKKFQEIQQAYEVLGDEKKKQAYDTFGHENYQNTGGGQGFHGFEGGGGFGGFGAGGFDSIFNDIFSQFSGGGAQQGESESYRGEDLKYSTEITLEEAFKGKKITIKLPRMGTCQPCEGSGEEKDAKVAKCMMCGGVGRVKMQQFFIQVQQICPQCSGKGTAKPSCKKCGGQGRVKETTTTEIDIPAGVFDNMHLRMQGAGNAGTRKGRTGDLFILIRIFPHQLFEVEGHNIICVVPITVAVAAIGGEIEIPTIEGGKIKIDVPAGSQYHSKIRIKGKGMPHIKSSSVGDMIIVLEIEIPTRLSDKERELWSALKENSKSGTKSSTFFSKVKDFLSKFKG